MGMLERGSVLAFISVKLTLRAESQGPLMRPRVAPALTVPARAPLTAASLEIVKSAGRKATRLWKMESGEARLTWKFQSELADGALLETVTFHWGEKLMAE